MENERILQFPALALVLLLHGLLLWALWRDQPPQINLGAPSLSFVDMATIPAGGGTATPAAAPQPQPAHQSTHQPQPQSQPTSKPQIKPVTTAQHTADLPKPAPQAATTPHHTTTTQPTPTAPHNAPPVTSTNGSSNGASANSDNNSAGHAGNSSAGGGGSIITPQEYQGGYLAALRPEYPQLSRENGEEGNVGIAVSVAANGIPTQVRVSKSSSYPRLDRAARQAVQNYRFKPATRGGVPIPYNYQFTVQFTLRKAP